MEQTQQKNEPKKRLMSPLIDKTERDKLWKNGQSLDSK